MYRPRENLCLLFKEASLFFCLSPSYSSGLLPFLCFFFSHPPSTLWLIEISHPGPVLESRYRQSYLTNLWWPLLMLLRYIAVRTLLDPSAAGPPTEHHCHYWSCGRLVCFFYYFVSSFPSYSKRVKPGKAGWEKVKREEKRQLFDLLWSSFQWPGAPISARYQSHALGNLRAPGPGPGPAQAPSASILSGQHFINQSISRSEQIKSISSSHLDFDRGLINWLLNQPIARATLPKGPSYLPYANCATTSQLSSFPISSTGCPHLTFLSPSRLRLRLRSLITLPTQDSGG